MFLKLLPVLKKVSDFAFKGGHAANKANISNLKYPAGILNKRKFLLTLGGVSIPVIIILSGFILLAAGVITFEQLEKILGFSQEIKIK